MSGTARPAPADARQVRIFLDGAFDLTHYGHMNAFRLARSLGTHLVVGVNSDESTARCKGPPLYDEHERLAMVRQCKFVDQVLTDVPYVMTPEYLDDVIRTHRIDYVVHGDDPCLVDGKDVYAAAKQRGKFRSIPRTEGVSTTDIVGRILRLVPMLPPGPADTDSNGNGNNGNSNDNNNNSNDIPYLGARSQFLATASILQKFANDTVPSTGSKIVYVCGHWDLFHPGHVAILRAAKARGDYLIVGVCNDTIVHRHKGNGFPVMNMNERVLSVMSCRFVDDVVVDPPSIITPQMVASLRVSEVVHCTARDAIFDENDDIYRTVKIDGILHVMPPPNDVSIGTIVDKIKDRRKSLQDKYDRKKKAEDDFYREKYGLEPSED